MTDGIFDGITIQAYHADREYISATGMKMVKKSLKLFDWWRRGIIRPEDKLHFSFGNAFELALLDPEGFKQGVGIAQTRAWIDEVMAEKKYERPAATKKYKEKEEKFLVDNLGRYIVPDVGEQSYEVIEKMLESCYQDSTIQKLIKGTQYQLSLFWSDPETGLKMKTRPDICKVKKNVIVNLKTTEDGSPEQFTRDLCRLDYPLQAAIEIEGCLSTGLMSQVDNYFWLVVEKQPPYNATIYEFDKTDIQASRYELSEYKSKIKAAQDQNLFPGYSDRADNNHGILTARIPGYYYNR